MATTGNGSARSEGAGAEEKFRRGPYPDRFCELKNSTGESELSTHQGGNSAFISAATWIWELVQMLKQITFTSCRCDTQRLTEHGDERDGAKPPFSSSPSSPLRLEAPTPSGTLKEQGDNFHAAISSSRVLEEQIASRAMLGKAYKGSTIRTTQAPRQDSELFNNNATSLPITSIASPQHPVTMGNLPDELLLNIFIRLKAKQLAQMRSVSKSWNALLSQSSFVKSHLDNSIHNNNDQILLVFCPKLFKAHISRSPHLELTEFNKFSPVDPESGCISCIKVIGAVNGLICSFYNPSFIHIWNPSLSAMLTLPPYSIPLCRPYDIDFRFGFDPKTNDYKVVKLTRPGFTSADLNDLSLYYAREWLQVEVYSMRKGSWELITERFPSHIRSIYDLDFVCADGHSGYLHWLCCYSRGNTYSRMIVAFDLVSEIFHEIPLADSILEYQNFCVLGVLAEKLCVMTWGENDALEVWVIDEYAVADSWVKRHVFSQFSPNTIPFGFTTHSEFVIEDIDNRFLLYDPVADKAKFFLNYSPWNDGIHKFVEYVDSLVWVAPAEHE